MGISLSSLSLLVLETAQPEEKRVLALTVDCVLVSETVHLNTLKVTMHAQT